MRIAFKTTERGAAFVGAFFLWANFQLAGAAVAQPPLNRVALAADVVILGEVHDNAAHHQVQAAALDQINPKAVIWEMISPEQAEALGGVDLADSAAVAAQLDWAASGWPDFSLYAPVFAAADGAAHYGAHVPRAAAGAAMQTGAAAAFGDGAARFGLDQPLSADAQAAREADQLASHCDALPEEMLPLFVDVQRLRDTVLARAVTEALADTGGPVAVITGNGHARKDRGIPVYLAYANPDLTVFVLGQSEGGLIEGGYDQVLDADPVERPDPCEAFRKG